MMTRIIGVVLVVMIAFGLTAQAQKKYVGLKACATCHSLPGFGNQVAKWKTTDHAKAYVTLTGAKAAEIAKAKGIKNAAEAPECLSCHGAVDAKLADKTYDVKDGVQCEVCHGAGSAYKTMPIMKDHAKSVANGMNEYKDKAAMEQLCKTCHNDKSPTHKEFKFDEMWAKIQHPAPKKS